jgi:hypothetical protein
VRVAAETEHDARPPESTSRFSRLSADRLDDERYGHADDG